MSIAAAPLIPLSFRREKNISFEARCPSGHRTTHIFVAREFREQFDEAELYCMVCDARWKPTEAEKAKLRHYIETT